MLKIKTGPKNVSGESSLLANFSSKSRYAESFRTLRTNLYFSMMDQDLKSLIITSALPGEGKSNTVANLAFTIAQTGKSVLMVDADLRKPGLSTRFSVSKVNGFTTILSDVLGRPINQGTVSDYGLSDIIKLQELQHRTCIMTLKDGSNEIDLYFSKGKLVDIFWINRPDGKKLASVLVREKILSENDAKIALGHQKQSVRRLGTILLAMGMLEEKALKRILSIQVMEAYQVVQTMANAEFVIRSISEEEYVAAGLAGDCFAELSKELFSSSKGESFFRKSIDENIVETGEKNLFVLPSGPVPPNPSELLGSERTVFLIKLLKKKFDVVIIDSSPIIPATDALLMAPLVDAVAFVVLVGETNRSVIIDAIQQIKRTRANLLGVVLNRADTKNNSYYYKYYKSYYGE